MKVDALLTLHPLFEANIYNIKVELDGMSIVKYLKSFTENLPEQHRAPFVKKISHLLVNDERFHQALRQLPSDAPEWAQRAVAAQELYAFKPTDELTDTLNHITHYLTAAAEDAVSSKSPDQKVVAQRELDAFPKAENIDVIKKKADTFFARGSRKAGREIAGMKQIYDAGGGYMWYMLTDNDAFRREGRALQNCIGRNYTVESTEKAGESIAVLKTANNDSVVAMRIKTEKREMQEMKGKNNKPPIEKYMIPTLRFINHMKIEPAKYAMYDLRNAGYYWDEKNREVITRAEAVQRFVKVKPIADVTGDKKLVEAIVANETLTEELYGRMVYGYGRRYVQGKNHIYELRNKDNVPVMTAFVDDTKLTAIVPNRTQAPVAVPVAEAEAPQTASKSTMLQMVKTLLEHGLVTEMEGNIERFLLWKEKVEWDPANKAFRPLEGDDADVETDKEQMSWSVYSKPEMVKRLRQSLVVNTYSRLAQTDPNSITRVYVDKGSTTDVDEDDDESGDGKMQIVHVVLRTTDDLAVPLRAVYKNGSTSVADTNFGYDAASGGYLGDATNRNDRIVQSLITLANRENLQLPQMVRVHHGIIEQNGKYEQYKPNFQQLSGKQPAVKTDLSKLSLAERLAALQYISSDQKYVQVGVGGTSGIFRILNALGNKDREEYGTDLTRWNKDALSEIYQQLFNGATPDALYVVDVKYGVDRKARVTLVTQGTKIVRIDSSTLEAQWQKWSDYDDIATQLNTFAQENGLTFDPMSTHGTQQFQQSYYRRRRQGPALKKSTPLGELRVENGKLISASTMKKTQIEQKRERGRFQMEGTDELTFADGTKLVRMDPEEQALWMRQVMKGRGGSKGEAWKIMKDNRKEAIFTMENGRLVSMFGRGITHGEADAPVDIRGLVVPLLPYVKKAGETFGWRLEASRQNTIQPGGQIHQTLRELNRRSYRRMYLRQQEKLLVGVGAVSEDRLRTGYRATLSITAAGARMLQQLERNQPVALFGYVTPAQLPADYVAPERRVVPQKAAPSTSTEKKPRTSTAAPRTGTKADQALARFREMSTELGRPPTRSEFINILTQPPFNMSRPGAQTYYYTTKGKYAALGEAFSMLALEELKNDPMLKSLKLFLTA